MNLNEEMELEETRAFGDERPMREITDLEADETIEEIIAENAAAEKFNGVCDLKIAYLQKQKEDRLAAAERDNVYRYSLLREWMKGQTTKKAKTSESIKMPSGTVRLKYAASAMEPDKDKLAEKYKGTEYVELKPSLKWGELKKKLAISGGIVVDTITGEAVDDVKVVDVPEKITIE